VSPDRPTLLAAIDRRLWRDLGFADPEPAILRFLPMLVVAWSDGRVSDGERERVLDRADDLPEHLRAWVEDRLRYPPGPYFRYQVAHLLAFLSTVWPSDGEWAEDADAWADELIQEAGWIRRLFGGVDRERRDLSHLRECLECDELQATERIWALARGAHAEFEPRHATVLRNGDGDAVQGLAITLDGPKEHIAVGTRVALHGDEDLDPERVGALLLQTTHLREPERWIVLAEEVNNRGRPVAGRPAQDIDAALAGALGHAVEIVPFAELAYLEDALAVDARWMSWVPGKVEALRVDREGVERRVPPGTFRCSRAALKAHVEHQPVAGPPGMGFRILHLEGEGQTLRLASPVILKEPATHDAVAWIARFLPSMCDPCTQLILDEEGPSWIAEVRPDSTADIAAVPEPLPRGRALLVPPWIWFRVAGALGVRFFAGRRRMAA
jgi:hypothetical protein